MYKLKYIALLLLIILLNADSFSQTDTIRTTRRTLSRFSAGGVFINVGMGLEVPLGEFYTVNNPTFGILGRLEVSTSGIFPFVIGGEISYFSYPGDDEFMTFNQLNSFKTKKLGLGLNIEYALSRLFKITYAIPFVALDVKYNKIKREISPEDIIFENYPVDDTQISVGAGAGITLFIFDVYVKFNYMKGMNHIGAYSKVRLPVFRF